MVSALSGQGAKGVKFLQNWNVESNQLINIVVRILLAGSGDNQFSLDAILMDRKSKNR